MYTSNMLNLHLECKLIAVLSLIFSTKILCNAAFVSGSNPCASDNGGCSHLCFAKPGKRKLCSCPTHYTLSVTDNQTCKGESVTQAYMYLH